MNLNVNAHARISADHGPAAKPERHAAGRGKALGHMPNPEDDDPVPPLPWAHQADGVVLRTLAGLGDVQSDVQSDAQVVLTHEEALPADLAGWEPEGDGLIVTAAHDLTLQPVGSLFDELK